MHLQSSWNLMASMLDLYRNEFLESASINFLSNFFVRNWRVSSVLMEFKWIHATSASCRTTWRMKELSRPSIASHSIQILLLFRKWVLKPQHTSCAEPFWLGTQRSCLHLRLVWSLVVSLAAVQAALSWCSRCIEYCALVTSFAHFKSL